MQPRANPGRISQAFTETAWAGFRAIGRLLSFHSMGRSLESWSLSTISFALQTWVASSSYPSSPGDGAWWATLNLETDTLYPGITPGIKLDGQDHSLWVFQLGSGLS